MVRGEIPKRRKIGRGRSITAPRSAALMLGLWGMILFALQNPEAVAQTVIASLKLCALQVIPVLFPIAAAGSLLTVYSDLPAILGRSVGRLFRLSSASVGVVLISLVAGFPIGAMLASRLWESGRIGEEEAARLACYTNNASGAFLTGFVGRVCFGNGRIGWILWLSSAAAALTVGLWMGAHAPAPLGQNEEARGSTISPADCIKSTALGMLYLTAFVSFFAVFGGFVRTVLAVWLPAGRWSDLFCAILSAFLEITGGVAQIASLSLPLIPRIGLAGLAVGWSGLSVILQCMAAGRAVNGRRLLRARGWIALLCGAYGILLALFFF